MESELRSVTGSPDDEDQYDINTGVVYLNKSQDEEKSRDAFSIEGAELVKSLQGLSPNRRRSITTLQKVYEGKDGAKSKKEETNIVTGYNAFDVVMPPYNLDYLGVLYTKSPWHYSAINAKVSNIVGLGWDFIESPLTKRNIDAADSNQAKLKKIRKKLIEAKDSLDEMIEAFNEEDTFEEILAKVWRDYEAMGNGYIEIGRSEATGKIGYIGHIPAATVRVRRKRDGFVQIISNKAAFFRNFGKDDPNPVTNDSNPNEIIHLKKYSPAGGGFYGVPDIMSAQQAVAGNEFAARFNLDYFENKAVPRHVIILKGATINPKLAKNILEFFETMKGQNHRSLFIPLPGDTNEKKVELKIEPVEAGIQDASFTRYRADNKEEILAAHRTPITKVSTASGISLAVARDADKTFKEQVCQPEQRILEKKLNKIIKELTDLFVIKLNEMTLTDEDTQSKIDERMRKSGNETANEQRNRKGQPSISGGDELFDLNAKGSQIKAEAKMSGNRARDAVRSANATDSVGEGRNPKGDGRTGG